MWMPNDDSTVKITTFEEARESYGNLVTLSDKMWRFLMDVAEFSGRVEIIKRNERYFNRSFSPNPMYNEWTARKLFDAILSDLRGCIMEVVVDDIVSVSFYRESLRWYEMGHWRCGIDESGRRLIW
jgi:hypothetical protein